MGSGLSTLEMATSAGTKARKGTELKAIRPQLSVTTNLMLHSVVAATVGVKVVDTGPAAVSVPVGWAKLPAHEDDHVYVPGVVALNEPPVTVAVIGDAWPLFMLGGADRATAGARSIEVSRPKL